MTRTPRSRRPDHPGRDQGSRLRRRVEGQGKDAYGKQRAGFTAQAAINRLDFGIKWNPALEAGGFAVSNRVKLTLHIAAVREDRACEEYLCTSVSGEVEFARISPAPCQRYSIAGP